MTIFFLFVYHSFSCRKKLGQEPLLNAVAQMPPPPIPPQPQILCTWAQDALMKGFERGKLSIPHPGDGRRWLGRIGRGGRLIFDRSAPFTWRPLEEDEDRGVQPMYEFTNPYGQWSSKNDLAQAAMARLDTGSPASTVVKLRITSGLNNPTPSPASGNIAPQDQDAKNAQRSATPALGKRASTRQRGTS